MFLHKSYVSSALCRSFPSELAGGPVSPVRIVMSNRVLQKSRKKFFTINGSIWITEGKWDPRRFTKGAENLRDSRRVNESRWELTRVAESLQEWRRVYESHRELTRVAMSWREAPRVYESHQELMSRKVAESRPDRVTALRVYETRRELTRVTESLQYLPRVYEKWPRVAKSWPKWPRVYETRRRSPLSLTVMSSHPLVCFWNW